MTSYQDILGGLLEEELFWRDRYDWLKQHGYTLRTRYKPDWVPPWKGTDHPPSRYEEGMSVMVLFIVMVLSVCAMTHSTSRATEFSMRYATQTGKQWSSNECRGRFIRTKFP